MSRRSRFLALMHGRHIAEVDKPRSNMSRPAAVAAAGDIELVARNRAAEVSTVRRHPEELIGREIAQNAKSWAALVRLGVRNGTRLPLNFFYETGGPDADNELAEFLRRDAGYEVTIEPDGVSGRTPPMPLSSAALDAWVWTMLCASHMHGGAAFAGWTATVGSRYSTSRAVTRTPGQRDRPVFRQRSMRPPDDRLTRRNLIGLKDGSYPARLVAPLPRACLAAATFASFAALAFPIDSLATNAAQAAGSGAKFTTASTMVVNMADGALSATDRNVVGGPIVIIVHNLSSERRSFLVVRHTGRLPHNSGGAAAPFVPAADVVRRAVLAPGGGQRLEVSLPAGHYLLVESQTNSGTPIIANGTDALRASRGEPEEPS